MRQKSRSVGGDGEKVVKDICLARDVHSSLYHTAELRRAKLRAILKSGFDRIGE